MPDRDEYQPAPQRVSAFVAVMGPGASERSLTAPPSLDGLKANRRQEPGLSLLTFGEPHPTLDARESEGDFTYAGRCFPVFGSRAFRIDPGADRGSIEEDLLTLDGRFALLAWGPGCATAAVDVLGTFPFYRMPLDGGVAIATHLGLLRWNFGEQIEEDREGVAMTLLTSGNALGRTQFKGVERFEAG